MQIMPIMQTMQALRFPQKQFAAAIAVCFLTVTVSSSELAAEPIANPFAAAFGAGVAQKPAEAASAPASAPVPVPAASAASAPTPIPAPARAASAPNAPKTIASPVVTPVVTPPPAPVAPVAPATPNLSQIPSGGVSLMFDNADIYDVMKVILGDALKLDYIIDPSVQGRITLKSSGAVNLGDVYNVLEAALATSGVSIIKQDKLYRVTKEATALREKIPTAGQGPGSPVMQIIPVKFVQSSQLANTIRNFLGPQAIVTNDATGRYLIVADRASSLEKVVEMVALLDVDYLQQVKVQLIPLVNADAGEIAKDMDALFKTSGMFNWAGTDGLKVHFQPITRMNAVLVAGANDKLVETAERWIKTMDAEPKNGLGAFVHIYPVTNGNAARLADILRQLFGGASSGGGSTPARTTTTGGTSTPSSQGGLGAATPAAAPTTTINRGNTPSASSASGTASGLSGSVQVIPDEVTNTLIIKSSALDFQQIKRVLERLDSPSRQVLIQVMVAEVALNDTLQYGVEWWLNDTLRANGQSWTAKAGLGGVVAPSTNLGVVAGAGGGLSYSVLNSGGQIIGLLNLLSQDTNVNVISTPHVMAADGKMARIEVGDEIAVSSQTTSTPTTLGGNTISNSITYRPTGVILEVTPVISASGKVALTVSQEVSSVQAIGTTVGGITYPNFSKRKVSTEVVVENGKPLLIAGLIRDAGNNNVSGLPGLKDIPLIGALFGSTKKVREKTELIMSITSYIINTREEGDKLTSQFQSLLKEVNPMLKEKSRLLSDKVDKVEKSDKNDAADKTEKTSPEKANEKAKAE